jgi:cobalt-zinc-cadmium efflux system outer membrane protein
VADRQVAVASAEVDRAAWDLAASVRLQAGIVLSAQRRLEVTGRQIVAARELRDLVAASVTAGALPRLDRDIADVDLKRLEAAERVARGDVDAAIAAIKGLAGLAQTEPLVFRPIDVEVAASVMDTGSKLEAMRTDPSKRPDVAVSNAQLALLSAQTNLARQDARWNLQLTGGYMRTDMSFPQLGLTFDGRPEPIGARFHELQFGATLAIPWRNRNQGAIAAAVARESATTAERDAVAQEADAGLAAARARWVAGREAAALFSTDLLSLARQNVDVVQQTYLAGRGTLNDVLVERRRLLELEMDYTNLLAALLAADVELRKAMGVIR